MGSMFNAMAFSERLSSPQLSYPLTYQYSSAFEMLRYPGIKASDLKIAVPALADVDSYILSRVDIDGDRYPFLMCQFHLTALGEYSAHLFRQEADLRAFMEDETLLLDPHMDYSVVTGLSSEVRERLFVVRPTTIVRLGTHYFATFLTLILGRCKTHGRHDTDLGGITAQTCKADTSGTT